MTYTTMHMRIETCRDTKKLTQARHDLFQRQQLLRSIMNCKTASLLWGTTAIMLVASNAWSNGSGLPGDNGRVRDGVPPPATPAPQAAPAGAQPKVVARGTGITLALQATQAIAEACKQYPLAISVVNSMGEPILIYVPDGSSPANGYNAVRKGYTAVTFKAPTSQLGLRAQTDADFAALIREDPSFMAFGGGVLLKVGDDIVGAIGVSGAEPGHHDEECASAGFERIKSQLK
jgi:uncharacterized protein GlcG (DUF336 family)